MKDLFKLTKTLLALDGAGAEAPGALVGKVSGLSRI